MRICLVTCCNYVCNCNIQKYRHYLHFCCLGLLALLQGWRYGWQTSGSGTSQVALSPGIQFGREISSIQLRCPQTSWQRSCKSWRLAEARPGGWQLMSATCAMPQRLWDDWRNPHFMSFCQYFAKKKILWGHPPCKDAVKLLSTKWVLCFISPISSVQPFDKGQNFISLCELPYNYLDSFPFESCQWLFSRGVDFYALAWIEYHPSLLLFEVLNDWNYVHRTWQMQYLWGVALITLIEGCSRSVACLIQCLWNAY